MVQFVNRNPKPRPRFIEPMQCKRVPRLPEGEGWLYEIKQDGYRAIAVVDGNSALLYSMSGRLQLAIQTDHLRAERKRRARLRHAVFRKLIS